MPPLSRFEEIYHATTYRVDGPDGHLDIRLGDRHPRIDALLSGHDAREWAYITAWNPGSEPLSADQNASAHGHLLRMVQTRGLKYYEGFGIPDKGDWVAERSVWIAGMSRADAIEIGRLLGQNAVVVGTIGGVAELVGCGQPQAEQHGS